MNDSEHQNTILYRYKDALAAFGKREYGQAIALLKNIIAQAPELADAHHALGVCYYCQNSLPEAERSIKAALSIGEHADFYLNLGLVRQRANNKIGAVEAYRSSLRLNPDSAKVCNNLANLLVDQRQYDEAIQLHRHAIRIDPTYRLGYKNLGFALAEADQPQEAIDIYKSIEAWGGALGAMRNSLLWDDLPATEELFLKALTTGSGVPSAPWSALLVKGMTPELEKRAAYVSACDTLPELNEPAICAPGKVMPDRCRLRIGYLSNDFYNHATMHLLMGVLESHDRDQFDVRIFSYSPKCEDQFTERLRNSGLTITDVSKLSDRRAAEEIARQKVDILVDLKGYTKSVRLGITARRPAPIIVNWLGYPGTLGHPRLADYIIGDPVVTPPEDAAFYSERLALMPHCYQPNDRHRPLPASATRLEFGLPEQSVVFCNFNNAIKFNPQSMDIWCRLLKSVPNSVLWLLEQQPANKQNNLENAFRARDITADRIVYAPFAPQADHTARLRLADVALDTFPCTSHTSASDVLWAGVPLVTLNGRTFASRVATSLLITHGFSDLVAHSEEAYFKLASELAINETRRTAIKAKLDTARTASPLFDTAGFTRDLEALYRAIVRDRNLPVEERAPVVTIC